MEILPARLALVSPYPEMRKTVYQTVNHLAKGHTVILLYNQTPLWQLMDYSPLLIELSQNDPIIQALPKEEIILFNAPSSISIEQMVAILRHRLIIQLDGNQKGLCHYFLPEVASYLFSHTPIAETANWLAGMNQISFYRQTLSEKKQWLDITIDEPATSHHASLDKNQLWQLTASQQKALSRHAIDKDTAQWAQQHNPTQCNWEQQAQLVQWCEAQAISPPLIQQLRSHLHHHQREPWRYINTDDPAWQSASEQTKTQQIQQLKEVSYG